MAVDLPLPAVPVKVPAILACIAIFVMAAAYLIFLVATWEQDKKDRATRDVKVNEILDRLPKPTEAAE